MELPKLTICDSRGKESKTLFFVCAAFFPIVFKFFFAEIELPVLGKMPAMNVMDFGIAITGVLGIWVAREHKAKSLDE